jgi:hypothetical protein
LLIAGCQGAVLLLQGQQRILNRRALRMLSSVGRPAPTSAGKECGPGLDCFDTPPPGAGMQT